jgi:hypothetical protein
LRLLEDQVGGKRPHESGRNRMARAGQSAGCVGVGTVKQCAVLFLNAERKPSGHPSFLREAGFVVHELRDWPIDDGTVRDYHVVIVRVREIAAAPMLAARLRAKPHVDGRLLIALVNGDVSPADRRGAQTCGFDEVLDESAASRQLTARIVRGLRARPRLRCIIPPPLTRRSAA